MKKKLQLVCMLLLMFWHIPTILSAGEPLQTAGQTTTSGKQWIRTFGDDQKKDKLPGELNSTSFKTKAGNTAIPANYDPDQPAIFGSMVYSSSWINYSDINYGLYSLPIEANSTFAQLCTFGLDGGATCACGGGTVSGRK